MVLSFGTMTARPGPLHSIVGRGRPHTLQTNRAELPAATTRSTSGCSNVGGFSTSSELENCNDKLSDKLTVSVVLYNLIESFIGLSPESVSSCYSRSNRSNRTSANSSTLAACVALLIIESGPEQRARSTTHSTCVK